MSFSSESASVGPDFSAGVRAKVSESLDVKIGNAAPRQILICDRNPVLADGLRLILQSDAFLSGFSIVSEPSPNLRALWKMAPDILIIDPWQSEEPRDTALDLYNGIPDKTYVIAYCPDISLIEVQQLISCGFRGIVPKTTPGEDLVRIVSSVALGGIYIPDIYQKNPVALGFTGSADLGNLGTLTEREGEVLQRLALGSSMKEVAAALQISTKTVDT